MPDTVPAKGGTLAAAAGLAAVLAGSVLMGLLHVGTVDEVDPVRRTISEYALGPGKWVFDTAVLLIAAGSAAIFGTLVHREQVRAGGITTLGAAAWTLGLLTVVVFPKTDWSVGPSLGGTIHRYASVVAFVGLPVAVLAARAVHRHSPVLRIATGVLAAASLAWFGVILAAVGLMLTGGEPWWRAIPLGLVERGMAATEVAALVALSLGSVRARTPVVAPPLVGS
ncbi:DUF998 domain-containing protein [Prauserella oleivorans]|uniref:DUF998 domain-containing protein n=1 Tax=Prauserella oleivorans TaxID=1478153 RepID=A0ABW5WA10_9PSEU